MRLYAEESCAHEEFGSHGIGAYAMLPVTSLTDTANICFGGSRREVEVDYEAAVHAAESIDWEYVGAERFLSAVEFIVDAALRGIDDGL